VGGEGGIRVELGKEFNGDGDARNKAGGG